MVLHSVQNVNKRSWIPNQTSCEQAHSSNVIVVGNSHLARCESSPALACQKIFETIKAEAIQAYEYKLNHLKKDYFVAKYLVNDNFQQLYDAIELSGLEVRKSNILKGKSGVNHSFTIVANYEGIEDEQKLVAIDVIVNHVKVDASAVLSFLAKALDCRIKHRVLLVVPELEDDAKVLALSYNIQYIEAERSIVDATVKLQHILMPRSIQAEESLTSVSKLDDKIHRDVKIVKRQITRKRSSLDIMSDILTVASTSSSKTEIMACANLEL